MTGGDADPPGDWRAPVALVGGGALPVTLVSGGQSGGAGELIAVALGVAFSLAGLKTLERGGRVVEANAVALAPLGGGVAVSYAAATGRLAAALHLARAVGAFCLTTVGVVTLGRRRPGRDGLRCRLARTRLGTVETAPLTGTGECEACGAVGAPRRATIYGVAGVVVVEDDAPACTDCRADAPGDRPGGDRDGPATGGDRDRDSDRGAPDDGAGVPPDDAATGRGEADRGGAP